MLATRGIRLPDAAQPPLAIEMSQMIHRSSMRRGVTPAVLPKGFLLHCGRGRKILGYERLGLQGIRFAKELDARLRAEFSDDLLQNLAGNAFNGQSASAVCASVFAACGWAAGQPRSGICPSLGMPQASRTLKRRRSESSRLLDIVWAGGGMGHADEDDEPLPQG